MPFRLKMNVLNSEWLMINTFKPSNCVFFDCLRDKMSVLCLPEIKKCEFSIHTVNVVRVFVYLLKFQLKVYVGVVK